MTTALAGRFGLGGIDQVGYVVESIERSLPHYEALFGPFQIMEAPMEGVEMEGKEIRCKLKLALNNSGPIEIELIEVMEGETPHSQHLREHGEGPHHVRFKFAEGIEEKRAALEAEGYTTIMAKRFGPGLAFAYLKTPAALGGSVVELFESP